jgi:hypothetical protein
MPKRSVRVFLLGAVVASVGTSGAVIAGAANTGPSPQAVLATAEPGAWHEATAFGVQPEAARALFTLRNGAQVAVARGTRGRCLLRTVAGQPAGESCATDVGVSSGEGISVTDECGSGGNQIMEITGLAPEGATEVGLAWSTGATTGTSIVDGAFRFDETNPAPGAPYPTGVVWVSMGEQRGTAALPVKDGQFCLPST